MTHKLSPITCIALLAFCSFASAQDITISKDSLQVYNNPMSSSADEIIFTSHTSTAVTLDSAFITVAQMDTAGLTAVIAAKNLQAVWTGYTPAAANYQWSMDSVSPNTYKLIINYSSGSSKPLSFSGNGTTSQIFRFQIDACFFCSRLPEYPKFFKGTLRLFFSNGQVIDLKLWSQDLRVAVRPRPSSRQPSYPSGYYEAQTVNGPSTTSKRRCQPSTRSLSYRYLSNGRRILASDNAVSRKSISPFRNTKEGN
jgi:hypothetical protein